jgi:hypothetical protein
VSAKEAIDVPKAEQGLDFVALYGLFKPCRSDMPEFQALNGNVLGSWYWVRGGSKGESAFPRWNLGTRIK